MPRLREPQRDAEAPLLPWSLGLGQGGEKIGTLEAELGCKEVCSTGLAVGLSRKYLGCSGAKILERLS